MTRIATALLALAITASLPLYAQDTATQDSPPQDKPADRAAQAEPAKPDAAPASEAAPAPAQGAMPQMTPELQAKMDAYVKASAVGAQHKQLSEHFDGNWNVKATMWMDPSMPPMNSTGKSTNTTEYGGRHVRNKYTGEFMGAPFQGEALTSYDNVKGKYINLWIDSMGTGQYVTEGDYDPATKTYTFRGTMSDPTKPDKKTTMKDVVRIKDKDNHVMESYELVDGKENKMMVLEYSRAP
jgi:hypothetical protein